jgi:hypothetical protein
MCVFKYHAFIYFLRPPPWYGTVCRFHFPFEANVVGLVMIIVSLHFLRKNGSKGKSFFAKKLCDYRDYRYFAKNYIGRSTLEPWKMSPSLPSSLSTALCPLYGLLSSLWPSVPSTALCSLYDSKSTLRVLFPLYGSLPPLQLSVTSTNLCPLHDPTSLLRSYVPSMALCPLYGPLSPVYPYVPSTALCHIYCPLPPIQGSVPSMVLCPLYCPLSPPEPFLPLWPSVPSTLLKMYNGICYANEYKYIYRHVSMYRYIYSIYTCI